MIDNSQQQELLRFNTIIDWILAQNPTMEFWISLCGQLAPLSAVVVFLSPMLTMLQIRKDQSVGDLPLLPYTSIICSAFVWTTYGILKEESKIWSCNGVGLVLGCLYFLLFARLCPPVSKTLPGSVKSHIYGATGLVFLCLGMSVWPGVGMIGNFGVVLCVFMFASPLAALKVVLRTKSAKAIPLPFTIASVLNCFFWTMTGLFEMKDYAIYVPNLLGLSFSLIQVALKVIYYKNDYRGSVIESRGKKIALASDLPK
eukprot:CAMPEP_0194177194 /NCGR_PEP_ID=MMETSP0154-20130528/11006_1 /TAXON_ID=1049557 /ORGANISM="Thalassiothrix antarctica, Strain L6-D1" /LENGTH=256 /DNA_ID=CAMNT_0038891695 /DNA_START=1 /DNA_END=771 /DNA_ORIENTATION=-